MQGSRGEWEVVHCGVIQSLVGIWAGLHSNVVERVPSAGHAQGLFPDVLQGRNRLNRPSRRPVGRVPDQGRARDECWPEFHRRFRTTSTPTPSEVHKKGGVTVSTS